MVAAARLLFFISSVFIAVSSPAFAQQRGAISGKILDPDGLALPGATIVITNAATGFTREVVTADTGAYSIPNLEPGTYDVTVTMAGFGGAKRAGLLLAPGAAVTLDLKLTVAGVQENLVVTGEAPLVERTSNQIGGSLSRREIEEVPSNFRNFTGLTQLIPGMTPNPATSTFEGGQVVANGSPSQQNVYLIDGMYNNDDRLGGSQGTQVRLVLDNIEEYQVLANQYSSEYGGGAGAIINMVTRGGTNDIRGRVYSYFRDESLNARGKFLSAGQPKPPERTLQAGFGLGGPIVKNRAHFYFTYERDNEDIAGQKRFPAAAAPLAVDQVGFFTVRANNYFARADLQLNDRNFINGRWLLEDAASRGEGFNTNNETPDAQEFEADHDTLWAGTYTSVITDRLSSVTRFGRIGESLTTAPQGFFNDKGKPIGFDGRDPFSIGQRNVHASYITGTGGTGPTTVIRTYVIDQAFSYFVPNLLGGEHTVKAGGGYSWNNMDPRSTFDSGTFQFRTDAPYNPADPATYPFQFDVTVGPRSDYGYAVVSKDQRRYVFVEDKWSVTSNLTLNLGLRWDNHEQTPNHDNAFAPRAGFAWDALGSGRTVVRGGIGKFYAYVPVVHDLTLQQSGVRTLFPSISINANSPNANLVLVPDMITDTAGNPGVARLSPAGQAILNALARRGRCRHGVQPEPAHRQPRPQDAPHLVVERRRQPGAVRTDGPVARLRRQCVARSARRHRHQRAGERRAPGRGRVRPHRRADSGRGPRREFPAGAAIADERPLRRRLQVAAALAHQAHVAPVERPPGLHPAAQQLRRHRQSRRAPGVARQRPARRLRRVPVQPHQRLRGQRQLESVADAHLRHGGQRHQRRAHQRNRGPRRQRRPRQQRPADPRHRRLGPADRLRPGLAGPRRALRHPRARLAPGRSVDALPAAARRTARQPRLLL